MRFMDKMKQMAGKNPEKINKGLKTVSDKVNKGTGGKYSDKINQGTEKARGYLGTESGGQGQEGQGQQGQGQQGQEGQQSQQGEEGQGQQRGGA